MDSYIFELFSISVSVQLYVMLPCCCCLAAAVAENFLPKGFLDRAPAAWPHHPDTAALSYATCPIKKKKKKTINKVRQWDKHIQNKTLTMISHHTFVQMSSSHPLSWPASQSWHLSSESMHILPLCSSVAVTLYSQDACFFPLTSPAEHINRG